MTEIALQADTPAKFSSLQNSCCPLQNFSIEIISFFAMRVCNRIQLCQAFHKPLLDSTMLLTSKRAFVLSFKSWPTVPRQFTCQKSDTRNVQKAWALMRKCTSAFVFVSILPTHLWVSLHFSDHCLLNSSDARGLEENWVKARVDIILVPKHGSSPPPGHL